MQKDEDFTYVLSSSDNVSPAMASEFYSKVSKCLVTGLPRNDVLFLENNENRKDVCLFLLFRGLFIYSAQYYSHPNQPSTCRDGQ